VKLGSKGSIGLLGKFAPFTGPATAGLDWTPCVALAVGVLREVKATTPAIMIAANIPPTAIRQRIDLVIIGPPSHQLGRDQRPR